MEEVLNEEELRKVCKCSGCGHGVMRTGFPTFYTITLKRFFINMKAVQRQAGLEQMMGGSVALARVFSPNEDMAKKCMKEKQLTFCEYCMQKNFLGLFPYMEEDSDDQKD